jgi:type I restriction enzyme S subunit
MTSKTIERPRWNLRPLAEVCVQITDGKHGDCQDQPNSGFYFLSCKDVADGKLNYKGARQITEADFLDTHRRTKLAPSDILITNSGTIGRMALAPDNELAARTTFQKSVALLKPITALVEPSFLYYALRADVGRLIEFAGGTAQKNLLLRDIRSFEVPVPPLSRQRQIASALATYDGLIEVNLRRIAVLEEMTRRLFDEWFVRFRYPGHEGHGLIEADGSKLPEGWVLNRLKDLCQEVRETVDPAQVDPATPYVGLEHIPRRSTTLDSWGTAGDVASLKCRFRRGDILFGKIRPYFHKVSMAPFEGVCSTDAIVIRAREERYRGLVLALSSSDPFVAMSVQTSNGTKMPRANWGVMTRYPVPCPPRELLAKFEAAVTGWTELAANYQHANWLLSQSRDLLLPRLISGELSVDAAYVELEAAA